MAIALLLLMAYSLIGEAAHEWIGLGMFTLVITHNLLNLNWYRNLFKGKYTAFRIFQLILDISLIFIIIGLMVSGISLSRYALTAVPNIISISSARILHMMSAYWGFVLMSLHIGIHANMMINVIRKVTRISKPSVVRTIILRTAAALIGVYGVYALIQRKIVTYMFLQNQFVFFDFEEPLAFFFIDYIAVMALFTFAGHYISVALRKSKQKISK
jgi:hypothetical protein